MRSNQLLEGAKMTVAFKKKWENRKTLVKEIALAAKPCRAAKPGIIAVNQPVLQYRNLYHISSQIMREFKNTCNEDLLVEFHMGLCHVFTFCRSNVF